jgi:hypothetical protein
LPRSVETVGQIIEAKANGPLVTPVIIVPGDDRDYLVLNLILDGGHLVVEKFISALRWFIKELDLEGLE